jgi:hypothetical protein
LTQSFPLGEIIRQFKCFPHESSIMGMPVFDDKGDNVLKA